MYDHFGNKKTAFLTRSSFFGAVFGWLTWEWLKRRFLTLNLSKFFGQLDVIKQLFLSFEHFETKFVFFWGGGGRRRNLFSMFFPRILFFLLSSFFTACFVAHFIVFPLCGVLAGYTFSGKKGKE